MTMARSSERAWTHGSDALAQPALLQIADGAFAAGGPGRGAEVRLYLKAPPSPAEVLALAGRIGRPLREILRRQEAPYRELGLAEADDAALARAMAAHPILIERPILDTGTRAVIGRPPEDILALALTEFSYENSHHSIIRTNNRLARRPLQRRIAQAERQPPQREEPQQRRPEPVVAQGGTRSATSAT
jgi:arsenate reductase